MYSYKGDRNIDLYVLPSLKNIAVQSKENLDEVVRRLKEIADSDFECKFLNSYIRDFKGEYYRSSTHSINLETALRKYAEII